MVFQPAWRTVGGSPSVAGTVILFVKPDAPVNGKHRGWSGRHCAHDCSSNNNPGPAPRAPTSMPTISRPTQRRSRLTLLKPYRPRAARFQGLNHVWVIAALEIIRQLRFQVAAVHHDHDGWVTELLVPTQL